jgi:glycosyltransferase involved in cell wall biosynthesis
VGGVETVCHVITKLELGGAQEVALYTVAHLNRTKFRPVLIAGPGGLLTDDAKRLPGVEVIILSSLGRPIDLLSDVAALLALIRLFRRLRPAIVHTHSSKAGILGRWAAWFARVPVILHTIHGYGITPAQPFWLRRCLILLERVTGWITSHWIAVAQADRKAGIQWGLFDEQHVSVVRPGIDPNPFVTALSPSDRKRMRAEFGASPDDWLIGTVACLKPQKAPEDFVAVASRVCETMPQARFVLIGDGELRSSIEALVKQYGLKNRVHLAGWRRDISTAMKAFDAFLLTSHWEGLPRVLLEARAAGIPVVATRVGGVEEVIVEGRHGWLCRAGDVFTLSQQLCHLLQGWEYRSADAPLSAEALPKEFDRDEMVKQYESLYDKLLIDQQGKNTLSTAWSASKPHP